MSAIIINHGMRKKDSFLQFGYEGTIRLVDGNYWVDCGALSIIPFMFKQSVDAILETTPLPPGTDLSGQRVHLVASFPDLSWAPR